MTINLSAQPAYLLNPIFSKFLSFLLHNYHILQLIGKMHVIPDITFSPHNIKILPTHQLEFLNLLVIPLNFFRNRQKLCVNYDYCDEQYYCVTDRASIRRLLHLSHPPLSQSPLTNFHQACFLFCKKYFIKLLLL